MELNKYTRLTNLDYVMASHQDPDIITSMPRWLVYTDAKVVASKLWARFLPHLNSAVMSDRMKGNWLDRLVELPDQAQIIPLGNANTVAVPAHWLYLVGNFQVDDPIAKILFSEEMGVSMVDDADKPFENFAEHITKMKRFHQRYLCNDEVIRLLVNMVRGIDIQMIV